MVKKDELIQVKYPKRVCYVCGRTEKDLAMLFNEPIKKFNSKIKTLENEIKKFCDEYKKELSDLIKDTEKCQYLDLKIGTIKTDLPKFKEALPRLDDLLVFGNDTESLSEIMDGIKKAVEDSNDLNIYENIESLFSMQSREIVNVNVFYDKPESTTLRKEYRKNRYTIDVMKEEIDALRLQNKKHELYKYAINSKDFYQHEDFHRSEDEITGKIVVYICAVCADMFSRASSAAYKVINSDDD